MHDRELTLMEEGAECTILAQDHTLAPHREALWECCGTGHLCPPVSFYRLQLKPWGRGRQVVFKSVKQEESLDLLCQIVIEEERCTVDLTKTWMGVAQNSSAFLCTNKSDQEGTGPSGEETSSS